MRQHRLALRQTLASIGVLVLYLIATKDAFISRFFFFNFIPWLYIALLFSHHFLPEFLARRMFRREEKTLLVGSIEKATALRGWLRAKPRWVCAPLGLSAKNRGRNMIHNIPVLGGADRFRGAIEEHGVTQVIMLEFPQFTDLTRNLIATCDQLGVRLLMVSDLEEKLGHPVTHLDDDGFRFLGLREEPLENPFNRGLKRTIDFVLALPIMLLPPPLAVVVWLAQRLRSPGRFSTNRPGREFKIGGSIFGSFAPCIRKITISPGRQRPRTSASIR